MTSCICPSVDAQNCADIRGRRDVDDLYRNDFDRDSPCECSCHPPDVDEDDEFWDEHDQCGGCGSVVNAGNRYCLMCEEERTAEP